MNEERQRLQRQRRVRRYLSIAALNGPAVIFMLLIFVSGLIILFSYSFYRFTGTSIERTISFESYKKFFSDPFYRKIIVNGFRLGGVSTAIALLIGYPTAYAMSRIRNVRYLLVAYIVIFSPLLVSIIVRAYGWLILLARTGLVNYVLLNLGIIEEPLHVLYDFSGVTIAMVHVLLPFTVFPILSVFVQMDPSLVEAAADLGAGRLRTFWHVELPISLPGVFSAFQFCFVLAMTAFATPRLLGGGRVLTPPIVMLETFAYLDWPIAALLAMSVLILVLLIIFVTNQLFKRIFSGS